MAEATKAARTIPNQLLRRERKKQGWSQQDLAERLGVTFFTVSRWERGAAFPHAYFRDRLCEIFAKSPQELGLAHFTSLNSQIPLYDPLIPPRLAEDKGLVGRDELLSELVQRLCTGKNAALSALNGLPGVGKTAIAVELAHNREILDHFRDGILWAAPGLKPNVVGLLGRWGTLLDLAPHEMATTVETLAKTLRSVIGERRMLLLIDDAWDIEEAMAFQVGGVNCAHLVTTRLPEIARQFAHDGAITVHELSEDEGVLLLTHLAPEVIAGEPAAGPFVRSLVRAVGGLPLAITLVGKYFHTALHNGQPAYLHTVLEQLQHIEGRMRLSQPEGREKSGSYGDALWSLETVIGISDQQLDEQARSALYALSIFPAKPNSFSEQAALAAVPVGGVAVLDSLIDAGLLESSGAGRYTLHPAIADYARLQLKDTLVTGREDTPGESER